MDKKSYWKPLKVDGQAIDLSHLEPFEWSIIPQNHTEQAVISVRLNDHCFTETFDITRHKPSQIITLSSARETRVFDFLRYELSRQLPNLIRALDGKRILNTRRENLVRIDLVNGQGYGIFLTLRREGARHYGLFVVSAYKLDRLKDDIAENGEMKFNTAVSLILSGKKPKFPHK